jgi:hypothetical protein
MTLWSSFSFFNPLHPNIYDCLIRLDWLKWKQVLINEFKGLGINRFKILITGWNHITIRGIDLTG